MWGMLVFVILSLPGVTEAKLIINLNSIQSKKIQTANGVYLNHLDLLILEDTAFNRSMHSYGFIFAEGTYDLPSDDFESSQIHFGWKPSSNTWGQSEINVSEAWKRSLGKNIKILILDSGIDKTHPLLSKNNFVIKSFFNDRNLPYPGYDQAGHGTHIAGLLTGEMGFGVAPEAELFIAKVCENSHCPESKIYEALNWGIENDVDVVNISLGRFKTNSTEKMVIDKLIAKGISVVAAAGNQRSSSVTYPARYQNVISVGASNRDHRLAEFSNHGAGVDLLAPGVEIFSSFPLNLGNVFELFAQGKDEVFQLKFAHVIGVANPSDKFWGPLINVGSGEIEDYVNVKISDCVVMFKSDPENASRKIKNALAFGAKGFLLENTSKFQSINIGSASDPLAISGVVINSESAEKLRKKSSLWSLEFKKSASGMQQLSGTSMSAAFVSGVVALIKSINPELTPAQIEEILKSTTVNGILNAQRATEKATEKVTEKAEQTKLQ